MIRCTIAIVILACTLDIALAHDSWINRGGFKNTAGEWCCGEGDCFVIPASEVKTTSRGYELSSGEIIPYTEALPSQQSDEGEINYIRCKRPDGTRRCFFAPMPAM